MNKEAHGVSTDPFVQLANRAIRAYVEEQRVIAPPAGRPKEMARQAGVFVSIKALGNLRGCIGTFLPSQSTVAEEIVANAIKAATKDPRFPPITPDELDTLVVSVDILSRPEPCNRAQLDPTRYGVIVEHGWRKGLLLPDLPGIDSIDEQIAIARRKAGIRDGLSCTFQRFTVERHT